MVPYDLDISGWLLAWIVIFSVISSVWKPWLICVTVLLAGFLLGLWRGTSFQAVNERYEPLFDSVIEVVGVIADDVGLSDTNESEFHITDTRLLDGETLPGLIRVRLRGEVPYGRGDVVQVRGKLYRTMGTSRQASMTFAKVERLKANSNFLEKSRSKFFATISQIISEPQASLGLGYIVGLRVSIPAGLEESLSITGLTHIVAVSGYNLTVIVSACRRLFAKRSAFQAVAFSGLLILGFLAITGWSAPLSRAAIIAGLSLVAWYYGRSISPILLLLISGAITGLITPFYVWGDVSWYLSFLAFFGVLVFAPLLTTRLYKDKKPNIGAQILIETMSAQLFAVPYIMLLFGTFSVIAPLANLLVLPPTPLIMLGIFATGLVGMAVPFLAEWLAVVPYLLLTFQVWLIELFSGLSWASSTLKISVVTMVGLYGLILLATIILWHKERSRQSAAGSPAKINWNMIQ